MPDRNELSAKRNHDQDSTTSLKCASLIASGRSRVTERDSGHHEETFCFVHEMENGYNVDASTIVRTVKV